MPYFNDPATGKRKRQYVYWGNVTDDLRFLPNLRFKTATSEERQRLIFPGDWDISATTQTPSEPLQQESDKSVQPDNSNTSPRDSGNQEFTNLLYGATWLLTNIAKKLDVIDDLRRVFENDDVANDILTLGMFPIISKLNYDQAAHWQKYTWSPSKYPLTSSYITRLTQAITDNHRMKELVRIKEQIKAEEYYLANNNDPDLEGSSIKIIYHLKIKRKGQHIWELHKEKVSKAISIAGFFSSISYKLDGNAESQLDTYAIRDEQEKYFEEMKDQLGFKIQRNWSEDGKTGRLFILFVGLILRSHLRWVWSQKLKASFPSSIDVLHEMMPIRRNTYPDGSSRTTSFNQRQPQVSLAYGLDPPEMSLSTSQKHSMTMASVTSPCKRGRPKGSKNRNRVSS